MSDDKRETNREGKAIECSACWAHPRTDRLCFCEVPTPPRQPKDRP